jgi:hypothetical protein
MARYNFHDYPHGEGLPDDINEPVKLVATEKLLCPELLAEINDMQAHKNCGGIDIFERDTNKKISMECNFGMFRGYDLVKAVETKKYIIIVRKFIKNHFLEMKKRKDGKK